MPVENVCVCADTPTPTHSVSLSLSQSAQVGRCSIPIDCRRSSRQGREAFARFACVFSVGVAADRIPAKSSLPPLRATRSPSPVVAPPKETKKAPAQKPKKEKKVKKGKKKAKVPKKKAKKTQKGTKKAKRPKKVTKQAKPSSPSDKTPTPIAAPQSPLDFKFSGLGGRSPLLPFAFPLDSSGREKMRADALSSLRFVLYPGAFSELRAPQPADEARILLERRLAALTEAARQTLEPEECLEARTKEEERPPEAGSEAQSSRRASREKTPIITTPPTPSVQPPPILPTPQEMRLRTEGVPSPSLSPRGFPRQSLSPTPERGLSGKAAVSPPAAKTPSAPLSARAQVLLQTGDSSSPTAQQIPQPPKEPAAPLPAREGGEGRLSSRSGILPTSTEEASGQVERAKGAAEEEAAEAFESIRKNSLGRLWSLRFPPQLPPGLVSKLTLINTPARAKTLPISFSHQASSKPANERAL
ncbi:hypothetical protein cyc_02530 [Cyclospora cayetanensis]|uniref:Uncharacterized protein n=1 Tax=Cyclospora cayetanensis TaxID=88456 RepID=A0A1D3D9M1_9EIME|nr:hypothetical protein cyc_02530 [Cyclospora cayetanensis]